MVVCAVCVNYALHSIESHAAALYPFWRHMNAIKRQWQARKQKPAKERAENAPSATMARKPPASSAVPAGAEMVASVSVSSVVRSALAVLAIVIGLFCIV